MKVERFKLKHIEEALIKSAGIHSVAAKILAESYGHCSRQTVSNYVHRHPALREACDRAVETNLDVAESKLLAAIGRGDDWAVKFYLETKGKHRGYAKRQEITGAAGQPVMVTNAREWLTAELDQMESRLRHQPGGPDGPAGPDGAAEDPPQVVH